MSTTPHRASAALEELIGYRFRSPALLKEAVSHRSYASEAKTGVYNERLEFLGDSILAAVVAHDLFVEHPADDEGSLSKQKAHLVSRPYLAERAAAMGLGAHLYLGVGEEASGGRSRASLLANAMEALIGAIYLDGGYPAAARFIRARCLAGRNPAVEADFKSRLQEHLQKRYKVPPTYEMVCVAGPHHDRTFEAVAHIKRRVLGRGQGKTKKEAEQAAARNALDRIEKGETPI